MKLKGQLSISHCSDDTVRISLQDDDSRVEVIEMIVSPEAYGRAVAGWSAQKVEYEVEAVNLAKLGKKQETKTVRVPFTCTTYDSKKERALFEEAVEPYEIDGWKCYDLDAVNNGHRRGPDGVTTHFRRYV